MTPMVGAIIIIVLLLAVFPVSIMMTGAGLSALLGGITKSAVDGEHVGTEDLAISESNPYSG